MTELNDDYRDMKAPTDVLAFPLEEVGSELLIVSLLPRNFAHKLSLSLTPA